MQNRAEKFVGEDALVVASRVPCPKPVGRWNPRPHGEIVQSLLSVTNDMGFAPNLDKLRITFSHKGRARMFGTFPLEALAREDYGYEVGFANSIDKTLSLRIFFGTNVFICSNGMMIGEFSERRMHTLNLQVSEVIQTVMGRCEDVVNAEDSRLDVLKTTQMQNEDYWFFEAVAAGALAKSHVVDARQQYRDGIAIENPGTVWAFQNAVTAQWKKTRNDESMVMRSFQLQKILQKVMLEAEITS